MSQVAREAKLAKGTLYLYFETKEELFLALLAEHLRVWFAACGQRLDEARPQTAHELCDVLIESVRGQEALVRLLLLLNTVLRRQAGPGGEQHFRSELKRGLGELLAKLPLAPKVGMRVFSQLYALTVGWQQITEARMGWAEIEAGPEALFLPLEFREGFEPALRAVIVDLLTREAQWSGETGARACPAAADA